MAQEEFAIRRGNPRPKWPTEGEIGSELPKMRPAVFDFRGPETGPAVCPIFGKIGSKFGCAAAAIPSL